jgi:oligopeptidase B
MQTLSTEVRLIDTKNPQAEPVVFLPREPKHEYSLDHLGDRFWVLTNWQAPNNRLMQTTDLNSSDKNQWQEILPHDPATLLENIELFEDWLVVVERVDGLTRYRYRRNDETQWRAIDFGEPCYSTLLAATTVADTDKLRYTFSSFKTPPSVIDYDLKSGAKTVVKQDTVLDGFESTNYVTERVLATALDGTKIPISLIRHRDSKVDGTSPLLLYAYGSYGISMEDEFIASSLNLVNRGFVYAIAHIRGGQEMGRHWYDDGKLLKKKNTFTDFIDCTRYLVEQKHADPKKVFAQGGSAGGLLMGAVTNMAPELYRGIIAEVPFLDVVTTMLDDSIPLTTSEYDEWGNPNEKEFYDYMLSYSPYDNVERKAYPNILVVTGFHDSQVQYWEPAKWVAKLRDSKTDQNLLLLDVEMHAGHGGSSGRYDRYKEIAKMQAFVLMLSGIEE